MPMTAVNTIARYLFAMVLVTLATRAAAADTPFVIDTRQLVEVKTVEALPRDVKRLLGRQKSGVEGFADRWDKFNKTDVVNEKLPMRRFLVGGAGAISALVAYEQGGRAYSIHASAFALESSGWTEVGKWTLRENPYSLRKLLESVDSEHYPSSVLRPGPGRRDGPLRKANLSDQETREIQAATLEVFPGSLLNISGVVSGCPCEEGPACSDQVWVVAHRPGHTQGLELSRIDGHWMIGIVQQWWLSYEQIQSLWRTAAYSKALQTLNDSFPVCAKPAPSIPETVPAPHP